MRLEDPQTDTTGEPVLAAGSHESTPDGGIAGPHSARERSLAVVVRVIQFGPGVILIALVAAYAILSPFFLTGQNLQNLGVQTAVIAGLAIGQLMVIITRGVDISVGAIIALASIVPAMAFGGQNGLLFVLLALFVGLVVGVVNGGLIVLVKLPQPLMVTLATLGIVSGLALIVSDGEIITGLPPITATLGNSYIGPIPVPVLLVLGFAVLAHVFLARTRWGGWIYATGGNPEAARRLGIPVRGVEFSVYVICGLAAAGAALLTVGRTDAAVPTFAIGYELDAITAVILGGASLFGGRGTVAGTLVGALILGTIRNGLDLLSVEPFYQQVAVGVVVLIALQIDVLRGRLENKLRSLQSAHQGA